MKKYDVLKTNDLENLDKIISEKKYNVQKGICDGEKSVLFCYKECNFEIEDLCKKKILEKDVEKIKDRYKVFSKNIDYIKWEKKEKEALESLYTNETSTSIKVIKSIKGIFPTKKCPYCGIGTGDTIEHILPKNIYPEYSIFSKNLIPCCNSCNILKGDKISDTTRKQKILNFYEDEIPEKELLEFKIKEDFTLEIKVIEEADIVFKNHINTLHLIRRYKETSNDIVSEIKNLINSKKSKLTKSEIKEELVNKYELLKERYGFNYWEGLINLAISKSDKCLDTWLGPYRNVEKIEEKYKPLPYEIEESIIEIEMYLCRKGFRKQVSKNESISKHNSVEFHVVISSKERYDKILWKVTNTGKEAEDRDAIRGNIFRIKGNGKILEEKSLYLGVHEVECYLIKNGACIARKKRKVKIEN